MKLAGVLFCVQLLASCASSTVCDHAVVGAGPAGIYYAWRLGMDPNLPENTTICIFERLQRTGGRVASMVNAGPRGDLVVEPGAYRFVPEKTCLCMGTKVRCIWTPLTASLIHDGLNLSSRRYSDDASNQMTYNLFKIVDSAGENAGFAQFVWKMLEQLQSIKGGSVSVRTFFGYSLESIDIVDAKDKKTSARSPVGLRFRSENGARVYASVAKSVMLNLPQAPLMQVMAASQLYGLPRQLHTPNPAPYLKLYVHYNHAWWRGLNHTEGPVSNIGKFSKPLIPGHDTMHEFPGALNPAPLFGKYEDGHVRCESLRCRGYMQALYSNDEFALMFYRSFGVLKPGDAIVNVTRNSHGAAGAWLLDEVHSALLELHAEALGRASEQLRADAAEQPDHAVLAVWDSAAQGFGAACHFSRQPAPGSAESTADVPAQTLRPFLASLGEDRVAIASEAYGPVQCWAEGALQMAENALQRLGVQRPAWMPEAVHEEVLFGDGPSFGARHQLSASLALADAPPAECETGPGKRWLVVALVTGSAVMVLVAAVVLDTRHRRKKDSPTDLSTSLQPVQPVA